MASAASLETICTCKSYDHELARVCLDAGCGRYCCKASDHAIVMDGIEGFIPDKGRPNVKE